MPKKIKLSRKQMKKPDEFLTFSEKVWDWAEEHIWLIVGVIAVIIVGVFAMRLASSWYEISQDAPRRSLAQAEQVFNAPMQSEQDELSMDMSGEQRSKFETERQKYQQAIQFFQKVVDSHPESVEARLAYLYLGVSCEKTGSYQKSLKHYERFLETGAAKDNQGLKHSALMGIARVHYQRKDYEKSLNYLDKLIKKDSPYKNDAMLLKARCYHETGKEDEVRKILGDMQQKANTSWIARTTPFLQSYWEKKEQGVISIPDKAPEEMFQPVKETGEEEEEVKEALDLSTGSAGKDESTKEEEQDKTKEEKESGSMVEIPGEKVGEDSEEEEGLRLPEKTFDTEGASQERAPMFPEE
ncbi:MAG: tetratricopeptide repeat protein [bacterium]